MERDDFLRNISSRLGRSPVTAPPVRSVTGVSDRYISKPFGESNIDMAVWPDYFQSELEAIGGKVLIADSVQQVSGLVKQILRDLAGREIVTWNKTEFADWEVDFLWDELGAVAYTSLAGELTDAELKMRIRTAHIGITTVTYAVVNSGTLAFYTNSNRNRSVSLLPAVHLALIRESQLVARLGEALPQFSATIAGGIPSSVHFITGPSRSADIENDLSIGVHGPAALTAIICRGI